MNNQLFQFVTPEDVREWQIVNDQVMGGCSNSQVDWNPDGSMTFKGTISSENGGGFVSIRRIVPPNSGTEGLSICFKGDYKLKIKVRTDPFLDGVDYASFAQGQAEDWTQIILPFSEFKPYFRGLQLPDAATLVPAEIQQIGLLIGESQFGPFEVQIRRIEIY